MKNQSSNNGQSLIEMLAAIAVMIVVILALVAITTAAIRNASFARNQATATKYAQEGIEKVRAYRDGTDWAVFAAGCTENMSVLDLPSLLSPFERTIICSDTNEIKTVTVTVSWTDSKGSHKSEITTRFTNWK